MVTLRKTDITLHQTSMERNRFNEALLGRREFIYTLELVPGRGSRGKTQDDLTKLQKPSLP
jgi:hypothetical protein